MNIRITFFLISCFVYSSVVGQFSFTQELNQISDLSVSSGAPVAVSDMNGDGLDDIISLDDTRDLFISFQNQDGSFNVVDYPTIGSSNWGMTVADVDNDGKYEIFTGGAYNGVHLVSFETDGTVDRSLLDGPDIFVQAVSYFDVNNDGFLDAIACHDDGPNAVYINNGSGDLSYMTGDLPFSKFTGVENNSGNYGNVWSDVNGDGLMDYYIAKCRQGVTDPTDERRINQLWINNGDGTFTEDAARFNLDVGLLSWTTEFQDMDNDGDMDCLITNHDGPVQLFENINNESFVDITATSGINIIGIPIQAVMRDFDNDGFVDVFVTGNEGWLYANNGDNTFTRLQTSVSGLRGNENSFAVGDLNHDGFVDMIAGYGSGFNGPSPYTDDILWINNTNDNHWLAVELEGSVSNRGGVGARIELYGSWGMMVREVRAGESYGISHSLTQHFGIGDATSIDSIVVRWPSGEVDSYDSVSPDQFVKLREGNCITPPTNINIQGSTVFCTGEEVTLSAPAGFQYLWSTGATSQSITVSTSGVYNVEVRDGSDCSSTSVNVEVVVDPDESFELLPEGSLSVCEGDAVVIGNSLGEVVNWSTGVVSEELIVTASSTISAFAEGTCGQIESNAIEVDIIPNPDEPSDLEFIFTGSEEVTVSATGTGISWYGDDNGNQFLGSGNQIVLDNIVGNTTVYAQSSSAEIGGIISGGEADHTGSSEFNSDGFNGIMLFYANDPLILRTVTVDTDTEGERIIELRDDYGNVLQSMTVNLPVGKSKVTLNFEVEEEGSYNLSTNTSQNFMSFGHESPRLKRSATDFGAILDYPYNIGNLLSIVNSNFGDGFYYYFYDWEVTENEKGCTSDLVPLDIFISSVSNLEDNNAISLQPNPSEGLFTLQYSEVNAFNIRVLTLAGKELLQAENLTAEYDIDLSGYSSGVYILRMEIGEDVYFSKLVKI